MAVYTYKQFQIAAEQPRPHTPSSSSLRPRNQDLLLLFIRINKHRLRATDQTPRNPASRGVSHVWASDFAPWDPAKETTMS